MPDYTQTNESARRSVPNPSNKERERRRYLGQYSMMPRMFFGSGMAAQIGKSATLFYLALCEHANRNGRATFKAADRALASDTGMSERDLPAARKSLIGQGLISCTREEGHSYVYTLVRLELKWIPLKDRPRVKLKARGRQSSKVVD